ncbi:unnamed protein product [Protopolystoma xenopodis]|uniref:Uncharacterized protein n=1 Tax=Protopolystoma xenopodis TaxID=117903 RepID=A0A3S5CUV4_9PLAT|nr:unnamed protein product [Protopolystoma xenopodis]
MRGHIRLDSKPAFCLKQLSAHSPDARYLYDVELLHSFQCDIVNCASPHRGCESRGGRMCNFCVPCFLLPSFCNREDKRYCCERGFTDALIGDFVWDMKVKRARSYSIRRYNRLHQIQERRDCIRGRGTQE